MISDEKITLRPVGEADEDFLLAIYASTRAQELAMVPWSAEQKDAFLRMQFRAQKEHYAAMHPRANHALVCLEEVPVGRLWIDRVSETDVLHILDVTIMPEHRNRGVGSHVLEQIMDEAQKAGKAVTIYVESFNPSLRLFERFGFRKVEEKGFHFLMKANPQAK